MGRDRLDEVADRHDGALFRLVETDLEVILDCDGERHELDRVKAEVLGESRIDPERFDPIELLPQQAAELRENLVTPTHRAMLADGEAVPAWCARREMAQ